MLSGPPRIASLWDDLNPSQGGVVSYASTANRFTVTFSEIPEFFNTGANTFDFTLKKASDEVEIVYGAVSANDGLVGITQGGGAANPGEEDLSMTGLRKPLSLPAPRIKGAIQILTGMACSSEKRYCCRPTNRRHYAYLGGC